MVSPLLAAATAAETLVWLQPLAHTLMVAARAIAGLVMVNMQIAAAVRACHRPGMVILVEGVGLSSKRLMWPIKEHLLRIKRFMKFTPIQEIELERGSCL
jgi:hypothetical protein